MDPINPVEGTSTIVLKANPEDQTELPLEDKTVISEQTSVYQTYIRFGDKLNQLNNLKNYLNNAKTNYNNALTEVKEIAAILEVTGEWDNINDEILL